MEYVQLVFGVIYVIAFCFLMYGMILKLEGLNEKLSKIDERLLHLNESLIKLKDE